MSATSKEEIYFAVCNSILKLEVEKGHLKWTLSDISRESTVTRSLIYYYFGKEKSIILEEAYKFIIDIFFTGGKHGLGVKDRIKKAVHDTQAMPYLLVLYYLQRNQDTPFGRMIKKAENMLLDHLQKDYPELSPNEILSVYLMELGAIVFQLDPAKSDELFASYTRKSAVYT
jgi:AcrR family transcriptional regulator